MSNPADYRPRPGEIPVEPGVYRFRDPHGRVIYVGKAKNLRSRLSSYFQDLTALHPRTQRLVTTATSVDWTVVRTEVEALQLEYSFIKEYDPRFNVKFRDDKSYPYLAVTLKDKFPRIQVMRGEKKPGVRYFGPYAHAWAIRETVDLLLKVFPVRTCSSGIFLRAQRSQRPCLLGYIEKCSAPCVAKISVEEHRKLADEFCDFLAGNTGRFVQSLTKQMKQAAADLNFEEAARIRDNLGALSRVLEKSAVVLADATEADIFAIDHDELEAAVQVFHIRGGRIRGQRGWVVEKVEDLTENELMEHLIQQVYGNSPSSIPQEILVSVSPENSAELKAWLAELNGKQVELRVPQRGEKRDLLATVQRNATQSLALHKSRRAGDLTTRSQALQEIQQVFELDEAPLRIECFDVSHLQGTDVVASMVVFEDGLPKKSEYRRFILENIVNRDDTAWMKEVFTRRFRARPDDFTALQEPNSAENQSKKHFAYPPQLLIVDGGVPQVQAVQQTLTSLGIKVPLIGIAKRLEEISVPGQEFPIILPRASQSLYLIQRMRDEAHRFAISHHRQRRSKSMINSGLDGIPGLGPKKQAALLSQFTTLARVRKASIAELCEVPGIGESLAHVISEHLSRGHSEPVVNVTTGEIIE